MGDRAGTEAVFIYSPELDQYSYPADSPFITKRAGMTYRILKSMRLLEGSGRSVLAPAPAPRDTLEKFHSARYLDALARTESGDLRPLDLFLGLGTPDCPVFRGMYEYAALASGATLAGAEAILSGRAHVAFNPSGGFHHADPERAAGFCYLNDVALACLVLAGRGRRVFYLDIDVHHGDGVQRAFYARSDVFTMSFHETGTTLFPGTGFADEIGEGPGRGYCVNVPLPPGTYDSAYLRAFHAIAPPLIRSFGPDVFVLEIGMDALAGDPLAHLCLTNNVHVEVIRAVRSFGKPVLATGGGGYHPHNTARGWALAWAVLSGDDTIDDAHLGLGGVLLGSTDWAGGLRDRALVPGAEQTRQVEPEVDAVVESIRSAVFPLHGLK